MRALALLLAAGLLTPGAAGALGSLLPLLPVGLPPGLDDAWDAARLREFHPFVDGNARYDAMATDGDALYLAGFAETTFGGTTDLVLERIDRGLKSLWRVSWGGPGDEQAHGIGLSGEALYVTGTVPGDAPGDLDLLVQRWDRSGLDGVLAWSVRWGGLGPDEGRGIAALGDGVYVVGRTSSQGAGSTDTVALRFDAATGALRWSLVQGDALAQSFEGVHADPRGALLHMVGWWEHGDAARPRDGYYAQVDADTGALVRERFEGGAFGGALHAIQPLEDHLVLAGARGLAGGGTEAWALRIDPSQAAPLWETAFPGDGDEAFRAAVVGPERVVLAGEDGGDMLIAAATLSGEPVYEVLWNHSPSDAALAVAQVGNDLFPTGSTQHAGFDAGTVLHVRECSVQGVLTTPVDPELASTYLGQCAARLAGL